MKLKRGVVIIVVSIILGLLSSCNPYGKGVRILTVNLTDDDSKYASEIAVIKESLSKGGQITLNGKVCMEIDSKFETKYAISNSEGRYPVIPAIINFVGDNGWQLIQVLDRTGASVQSFMCEYIFIKAR